MRQSTGPDNLDLPYGTGTFAISHADDPAATCGFGSDYTGIDIELDAEVMTADVVVDLEAKIPGSVIAFVHL